MRWGRRAWRSSLGQRLFHHPRRQPRCYGGLEPRTVARERLPDQCKLTPITRGATVDGRNPAPVANSRVAVPFPTPPLPPRSMLASALGGGAGFPSLAPASINTVQGPNVKNRGAGATALALVSGAGFLPSTVRHDEQRMLPKARPLLRDKMRNEKNKRRAFHTALCKTMQNY